MDLDAIREEYQRILHSDNVRQMDLDFRRMARHIPGLLAELERFRVRCFCGNLFLPQEKDDRTCSEECHEHDRAIDAADRLGDEKYHDR